MSVDSETNYNIGVLILLVMVFWVIYMCNLSCEHMEDQTGGDSSIQQTKSDPMIYGNTPLKLGTPSGINYIMQTKNNVVRVPNSQTAMRHLFDSDEYKCYNGSLDDGDNVSYNDDTVSDIIMQKNKVEGLRMSSRNIPYQSTRNLQNKRFHVPVVNNQMLTTEKSHTN